jgi:hypothetical protein
MKRIKVNHQDKIIRTRYEGHITKVDIQNDIITLNINEVDKFGLNQGPAFIHSQSHIARHVQTIDPIKLKPNDPILLFTYENGPLSIFLNKSRHIFRMF